MTKDKSIFIKNIYYMLSYAFNILRQDEDDKIAAEEFDNIHNLFAAILVQGISRQLKQGLHREYPNNIYQMSGNKISIRTLDLNKDFSKIRDQLDGIVNEHFGGIDEI